MSRWGNLWREVIKVCHDLKWVAHPGEKHTTVLIQASYFWPHMRDDIKTYVQTCLVCQQDKTNHQLPIRLLEPLSITSRPWKSVTIDIISALPKFEECGSIMVLIDCYSKYATFIIVPTNCKVDKVACLFIKHVVKLWGVPKTLWAIEAHDSLAIFGRSSSRCWEPTSSSHQASTHKWMGKLTISIASSRCIWGTM